MYIQCERVSMGNSLSPTFTDVYMCHLENRVLEGDTLTKPMLYTRYVDDIFVALDDIASLPDIECKLSKESILSFTLELQKDGQLAFVYCVVRYFEEGYRTSVDDKNSKSICPEKYKVSVI